MNRFTHLLIVLSIAVAMSSGLIDRAFSQVAAPAGEAAATQPARGGGGGGASGGAGGGQPRYAVQYGQANVQNITEVLQRVHGYVNSVTPARIVNRTTGAPITDMATPVQDAVVERGDFLLLSYEWGVTYSGMLLASEATGDARYKDYVAARLQFVHDSVPYFQKQLEMFPQLNPFGRGRGRGAAGPATAPVARGAGGGGARGGRGGGGGFMFRGILNPMSLDDSGSLCAAFIKARRANVGPDMMPTIQTLINWVHTGQYRFADGTLARNRPMPETLWLDDLYMSVPALAQMGKLTGQREYYDDACKQILQFASRMFVKENGLWMHGWTVQTGDEHPAFHWARANGWALMAMTELLEVLPEDHPQRQAILDLYRAHVRGLSKLQSNTGLWHQLLDRSDSYLETSATAIYVYCITRGINRGWINAVAYGPIAELGWAGVISMVNEKGQVEGTCVGTGMAFDVAFYYARPTSVLAAHGYGPVLLAGAELINMISKDNFINVDGAVMRVRPDQQNDPFFQFQRQNQQQPQGGGQP